jgi:hypothetical protein
MNVHAIRVLTLAVMAAAISGCGGSSSAGSTASSSSATQAAASSTSAATASSGASATTAPAAASGVAAPGTKFAVGKSAVVALKDPSDLSNKPPMERLQVTVISIVKGSLADFRGVSLDAAQKAGIPFYVKVRIANVGPGDVSAHSNDPSVQIEGIDDTRQAQQAVSFIGDFPPCNENGPPTPMTRGKSFETCLTFLVPGGITAAAYTGTSDYLNSPVTWK